MERDRIYSEKESRIIKQKNNFCGTNMLDNRSTKNQNYLLDSPLQQVGDEDEETLQGKFDIPVQREEDEDDILQGKFDGTLQKKNETGMPDNLKTGIESLSGFSMDNVRVHYNSSKPASVQALAYTQGTDIHVAPGHEKCLPHEAWHVAQQMAGRVSPTTNINGMPVNVNAALEHEADVMGEKAVQCKNEFSSIIAKKIGDIALQRMSFTNNTLTDRTEQWESKGTPWHETPGLRDGKLSELVDKCKKEMLTYIAAYLGERENFGPHIAVVITGGTWYIALNSDCNVGAEGNPQKRKLESKAAEIKIKLQSKWELIKDKKDLTEKEGGEESALKREAGYIALRWAVRGTEQKDCGVVVVENLMRGTCRKDQFGKIHGEMAIISFLKRKSERGDLLWKTKRKPIDNERFFRVIRVGGTKTPCLDCFYEMGGCLPPKRRKIRLLQDGAAVIHDETREASMVQNRLITTMTHSHGPAFPTWMPPGIDDSTHTRNSFFRYYDPNESLAQNQNYEFLKECFRELGVEL